MIKILDHMEDKRISCHSLMLKMNISEYVNFVEKAYTENGGIDGQRVALKSTTAKRIRETMISDVQRKTVLPPLVLGVIPENYSDLTIKIKDASNIDKINEIIDIIKVLLDGNQLSIIDGMQRTTAFKEILSENKSFDYEVRIELWIAEKLDNLIYRMLILNTGQISWSLKKQLEVVFTHIKPQLLCKAKEEGLCNVNLIESNFSKRAIKPGSYQYSNLVELYLVFTTRKENINLSEEVAEKFAQLDVINMSSRQDNLSIFCEIFAMIVKLDMLLTKENIGKRIFGDQNARIGFVGACAKNIFGRAGKELGDSKNFENFEVLKNNFSIFFEKISGLDEEELKAFCEKDILNDLTTGKTRIKLVEFYRDAFHVLVNENFEIDSLKECWRAN